VEKPEKYLATLFTLSQDRTDLAALGGVEKEPVKGGGKSFISKTFRGKRERLD